MSGKKLIGIVWAAIAALLLLPQPARVQTQQQPLPKGLKTPAQIQPTQYLGTLKIRVVPGDMNASITFAPYNPGPFNDPGFGIWGYRIYWVSEKDYNSAEFKKNGFKGKYSKQHLDHRTFYRRVSTAMGYQEGNPAEVYFGPVEDEGKYYFLILPLYVETSNFKLQPGAEEVRTVFQYVHSETNTCHPGAAGLPPDVSDLKEVNYAIYGWADIEVIKMKLPPGVRPK